MIPSAVFSSVAPRSSRLSAAPAVFAAVLVSVFGVLGGCAGGSQYTYDTGDLAQRYLPSERRVEYPPDSLGAVSIVEADQKIKIELESSYARLVQKWSCRPRDFSARQSPRFGLTYATLWSRELSIAELQANAGVSTLSKEQALKMVRNREEEYESVVQIDVFWFGGPQSSIVTPPSARVELRTSADSTYRPTESSYSPVREALVTGGRRALYRRNTFLFKRRVNGYDVLGDATEIRLAIRPTGSSRDFRFIWSWKEAKTAGR